MRIGDKANIKCHVCFTEMVYYRKNDKLTIQALQRLGLPCSGLVCACPKCYPQKFKKKEA